MLVHSRRALQAVPLGSAWSMRRVPSERRVWAERGSQLGSNVNDLRMMAM
ncbi:MAG: hypothetical protein U1E16_01460 [Hyphomicrobiales bacterium]